MRRGAYLPATRDLFGRPLRRKPRDSNAEARRQAAIVAYVRQVVEPPTKVWHVPNGGLRDKVTAAKFKWMGVLPGVLDLTIVGPDRRIGFWEVKEPGLSLSDEQIEMIEALTAMGYRCAVVWSIEDARRELKILGIETREAV
jgi:hypothetical protein